MPAASFFRLKSISCGVFYRKKKNNTKFLHKPRIPTFCKPLTVFLPLHGTNFFPKTI